MERNSVSVSRLTRESDVSQFRSESGHVVGQWEVTYLGHDEVSPRKSAWLRESGCWCRARIPLMLARLSVLMQQLPGGASGVALEATREDAFYTRRNDPVTPIH